MKRRFKIFLISALLFAIIYVLGSHYINHFACKGCPPQTWSEIGDLKWGILIFSCLFGIDIALTSDKKDKK